MLTKVRTQSIIQLPWQKCAHVHTVRTCERPWIAIEFHYYYIVCIIINEEYIMHVLFIYSSVPGKRPLAG